MEDSTLFVPTEGASDEEQMQRLSEGIVYKAMDIANAKEAKAFLNGLDKTRALFRSAKQFKKYRKRFQVLEVESYVLLYQKGENDKSIMQELRNALTAMEWNAIEWLMGLPKDDRNKVIQDTSRLYTTAYKRTMEQQEFETGVHDNAKSALDVTTSWSNKRIMEFVDNSVTNISAESLRSELAEHGVTDYPNTLVADTQDGVKNRLLRAGAVGVGDGEYVSRYDRSKADKAIEKRVYSLRCDIGNLVKLIRDFNREQVFGFHISFGTRGNEVVSGREDNTILALLLAYADYEYSVNAPEYKYLQISETGVKNVVYSFLNAFAHSVDEIDVFWQNGSIENKSIVYKTVTNWLYDHSDAFAQKMDDARDAMNKITSPALLDKSSAK